MRTRSTTAASGLSPGRDHVLPPPTRKKRVPRAKSESGREGSQNPGVGEGVDGAAAPEPTIFTLVNALIPGANMATLSIWLYLFCFLLLLNALLGQARHTGTKRVAEEELVGRAPVRRRVEPVNSTPPVKTSGGGAVRRLLAAVKAPRRVWGWRRRAKPGPVLSPVVEGTPTSTPSVKHTLLTTDHPETDSGRKRQLATPTPDEDASPPRKRQRSTPSPDPATIRHPQDTSPEGFRGINLDEYLDQCDREDEELAERELAENQQAEDQEEGDSGFNGFNYDEYMDACEREEAAMTEEELTELLRQCASERQQAEQQQAQQQQAQQQQQQAQQQQAERAEAESAAVVPDALSKARALALKHKPETSSRLRFVERLSTSTVGTDLNEDMDIQPQTEEDEVYAAVAAISEVDLQQFNFSRAPDPGVAKKNIWRAVSAAVAAIPEDDLMEFDFPEAPDPGVAEKEIWCAVTAAVAGTPGMDVLPLFG